MRRNEDTLLFSPLFLCHGVGRRRSTHSRALALVFRHLHYPLLKRIRKKKAEEGRGERMGEIESVG